MKEIKNINQLKEFMHLHMAMLELSQFGENLKRKQLNKEELKVLFATLWAFFKETPSGILNLALRVNDYWNEIAPWDAMSKSAFILSAAVDEFGLDEIKKDFLPTHHRLFRNTVEFFEIPLRDLDEKKHVLKTGIDLGKASRDFYRNQSLPVSLGFHFASEFTSWPEFKCLFNGFWANKEFYGITTNEGSALKFFWIHTLIEPSHLMHSEKILADFFKIEPMAMNAILDGVREYFCLYEKFFKELNVVLFK